MSTAIVPATAPGTSHARERIAIAPITGFNFRDASASGDGSWIIEGYAAVFEQETTLYDGRFFRMREVISRGAFTDVLGRSPLVHLNFGHDMSTAVAATDVQGIGGLQLAEDSHGLHFAARVDPGDPDAVRLAAKMRRGVVRQASFAFTIEDEVLEDEGVTPAGQIDELYRIKAIRDLFDVCACAQGAYAQTESHLRALAGAYLGRSPEGEGLTGRSHVEGPTPVAPQTAGQQDPDPADEAATAARTARARERDRARAIHTGETR